MSSDSSSSSSALPPLSLSILGVEPLDEFIKEIADFVHYQIQNKPDIAGSIEVEAKVGVMRDKHSGQRIELPVLVESSTHPKSSSVC
jgi:polynucleotide 5'-triphosphatase